MMKQRILITGASGFLGYALCRQAARWWTVYATIHRRPVTTAPVVPLRVDLRNEGGVRRLFQEVRPQAVIHAAAVTRLDQCQRDPQVSFAINVTAAATIARRCAHAAIPMVFTSTDLVFDGRHPPYAEADQPSPLSHYGEQKAIAEARIRHIHPGAIICRLPLMFGLSHGEGVDFTSQMIRGILSGQPVRLFVDEFRTPVDIHSATKGLLQTLTWPGGIYHMGGRDRVSRFAMGAIVAERLAATQGLLQPIRAAETAGADMRPRDVSLDSRTAFQRGYSPRPVKQSLAETAAEFKRALGSIGAK
jgi:dTDP-4-dehydrorhamnose reductase